MPGQVTRTRQQQVIPYQANSLVNSNQLGLGMQYRDLILTLRGTLQTSGTSNVLSSANVLGGDEWKFVSKIEVVVNGGDVIQSFTGEELANLQMFFFDRPRRISSGFVGSNLTSSAFDSTIVLPFWDRKGRSPLDTMLDSAKLSDFRVQITWGNPDSATSFTGNTFTTAPSITLASREAFGLRAKNGKTPRFSVARRFGILNPTITNAQTDYPFLLPLGNIYKGIFINTKDSSGNDLAACIDRIKVVSGPYVYIDVDFRQIRDYWTLTNSAVQGNTDSTQAPLTIAHSAKTLLDAWTYLDFRDDGFNTEAIDTYNLTEFKLLITTNQTIATLKILPDQLVPVRTQTKAA